MCPLFLCLAGAVSTLRLPCVGVRALAPRPHILCCALSRFCVRWLSMQGSARPLGRGPARLSGTVRIQRVSTYPCIKCAGRQGAGPGDAQYPCITGSNLGTKAVDFNCETTQPEAHTQLHVKNKGTTYSQALESQILATSYPLRNPNAISPSPQAGSVPPGPGKTLTGQTSANKHWIDI